ncbi:MAG: DUF2877 domain-containing protein, partial [Anaerolineae bacterium]|nr:DUF2877 domain-containing protein [Anaerolineae bacterium]
RVGELIRELIEAVRNLDASVGKIVARLIGLGSGLTPSGDDFLVGFLTGLQCVAGSNAMRLIYLRELWKLVIRLSHQTNDISRTYLYHAAHGQVSSRLAGLATAITKCAGREQLVITTEEALHEGHTSGMDTVTGLLVGLATWGNGSFPVCRRDRPYLIPGTRSDGSRPPQLLRGWKSWLQIATGVPAP